MSKKFEVRTAELSKLLGMSAERLRQLAAQGHFSKPTRGVWNLGDVTRGLVSYLQDRLKERRDSPEFIKAREAKAQTDAKMAALSLAEKEHKFLPVEVVVRVWQGHIVAARQVIQNSSLSKEERRRVLDELAVAGEDYAKEVGQ